MKIIFPLSIVAFLSLSSGAKRNNNWYSMKFHSLCEERERNVTPETALERGKLRAYKIKQDTIFVQDTLYDSTRVSFDFISNCCEKFEATANVSSDTLNIFYKRTNMETCRCLCDYRFVLTTNDTTKKWGGIKIKRLPGVGN